MEPQNQHIVEEVKANDTIFNFRTVRYPNCPSHGLPVFYIPINNDEWDRCGDKVLKCPECLEEEHLDINKFMSISKALT